MITFKQRQKLMELIRSYGVDESLRGYFIAGCSPHGEERQEKFCKLKLQQIENFLDTITERNPVEN